ncbi:MAG: DUF6092 family protein [Candidatus Heimdallarchaeota archaeon]
MEETKPKGNEFLFEIAVFLATSARNCIEEPPLYGPFRLLDALSKLVDLPKYTEGLDEDSFLYEIKGIVDEKKYLVMYSVEDFTQAIEEIVDKFAKELKKRYLET